MDVGQRSGADGLLPGGLAFDDQEPEHQPKGGRWRTLAWLLALAGLLGTAGLAGNSWVRDADLRAVLDSSTATWAASISALRSAPDVAAVAAAASAAPAAAERLTGDLQRLRSSQGARAAVAGQVAAERDVLLAVAGLDGVDRSPLRVWGEAHPRLSAASAAEAASRRTLRSAVPDAAAALPDLASVLSGVGTKVGAALVADVTRAAGDLLSSLETVSSTAQLRAAAVRATAQRDAVLPAAGGLPGSADGRVLQAFAAALAAVADLRGLTPAETGAWPDVRGRLADRLAVVVQGVTSLEAGSVRARLPVVLAAVDAVVRRAAQAQAAWQPVHDAALAAQAKDGAALRRYAGQVRAVTASWAAVRPGLDAARAGPGGPALTTAADDAARVAAGLDALLPPAALAAAHAELRAAAGAAESALRVAVAGCGPCQPAEAAATGWEVATSRWEAAVTAGADAIAARALPPSPQV